MLFSRERRRRVSKRHALRRRAGEVPGKRRPDGITRRGLHGSRSGDRTTRRPRDGHCSCHGGARPRDEVAAHQAGGWPAAPEHRRLALRALTRRHRPAPLIDALIKAQRFSHLDFTSYPSILQELQRRNWFREPDEARLID